MMCDTSAPSDNADRCGRSLPTPACGASRGCEIYTSPRHGSPLLGQKGRSIKVAARGTIGCPANPPAVRSYRSWHRDRTHCQHAGLAAAPWLGRSAATFLKSPAGSHLAQLFNTCDPIATMSREKASPRPWLPTLLNNLSGDSGMRLGTQGHRTEMLAVARGARGAQRWLCLI